MKRIAYTTAWNRVWFVQRYLVTVALMWKQDFKSINIDSIVYKIYVLFNWHAVNEMRIHSQITTAWYTCNLVNGSEKSSNLCDLILGLFFFSPFTCMFLQCRSCKHGYVYGLLLNSFHQIFRIQVKIQNNNKKKNRLTNKKNQEWKKSLLSLLSNHLCHGILCQSLAHTTWYRSNSLFLAY